MALRYFQTFGPHTKIQKSNAPLPPKKIQKKIQKNTQGTVFKLITYKIPQS